MSSPDGGVLLQDEEQQEELSSIVSRLRRLSLSLCLHVWVCSLAPAFFFFAECFGRESEPLMLLLRHAALFSVHGFSSAAAAASGRSVRRENGRAGQKMLSQETRTPRCC